MPKIGSLVYSCDSGLGILAKAFYDHKVITDVMVVRHGRHETHDDWFPGAPQITDLRNSRQHQDARKFCQDMDVMLFLETPFIWDLIPYCKAVGVKTAISVMYECSHENPPARPDLYINPSLLDQQYYPSGVFIPVPVEYPWRKREKAEVFVHNAGFGGLKGRNGTKELLEAWEMVKSPAKLIVRSQEHGRTYVGNFQKEYANGKSIVTHTGTLPYEKMFSEGDVFVFPEGFNGLSLPLQEARAAGMLVMCGDRFPMNTWLPTEPLITVKGYEKDRIGPPYNTFDRAVFDPRDIAVKIDEWYGKPIGDYSESGREWAQTMSWEVLRPKYIETLEALCRGR